MKKFVFPFCAIALFLCSCSNKADKYLDRYEELAQESVAAIKAGDIEKISQLQTDVAEFQKENADINPNEFTPEQKERLLEITSQFTIDAMSVPATQLPDTDDPSIGVSD